MARVNSERCAEQFNRRLDHDQRLENRIHILLGVRGIDRRRKLCGRYVQKLLNHLIADHAAALFQRIPNEIVRDTAFGFRRFGVDLVHEYIRVQKRLSAHSSPRA
jgi:hypothetical protein